MTFIKKNTAGSSAGHSWEAGEVKDVHSLLADELLVLSPEDYELASEPVAEEDPDILAELSEQLNEVPELLGKVFPTQTEEPVLAPVKAKRGPKPKAEAATETDSAE